MKQFMLYISIFVPAFIIMTTAVLANNISMAQEIVIQKDPSITMEIESATVDRAEVLRLFLQKRGSPLAHNAETFVEIADRYGLDYRLLPAISCLESSCGIKLIPGSYNAWGWGIYGNNVIRFRDFDEGIQKVGQGLYEGYVKRGLNTPAKIAPIYTPPRPQHWLRGVNTFMSQMDDISEQLAFASTF